MIFSIPIAMFDYLRFVGQDLQVYHVSIHHGPQSRPGSFQPYACRHGTSHRYEWKRPRMWMPWSDANNLSFSLQMHYESGPKVKYTYTYVDANLKTQNYCIVSYETHENTQGCCFPQGNPHSSSASRWVAASAPRSAKTPSRLLKTLLWLPQLWFHGQSDEAMSFNFGNTS